MNIGQVALIRRISHRLLERHLAALIPSSSEGVIAKLGARTGTSLQARNRLNHARPSRQYPRISQNGPNDAASFRPRIGSANSHQASAVLARSLAQD